LIRRYARHKTETRRASKAFGDALEVGDNLVHVIKPVLHFRIVCTRALVVDLALKRRELLLHFGYKAEEVLGECQQIGELLLVVACALLVGDTLLRQEGNEPIRCALLALDNVLECRGGHGRHWR
jgi:hypothetical protein